METSNITETKNGHRIVDARSQSRTYAIVAVGLAVVVLAASSFGFGYRRGYNAALSEGSGDVSVDEDTVLPPGGIAIPVTWDDMGLRLTEAGVIDRKRFLALYENRGGLNAAELRLLDGGNGDEIMMTPHNAGVVLNLLWAFGLANKNEILENGPMQDERYGGAEKFASTGGWSLAVGDAMDHYSRYPLVSLTPEQQERVVNVSKGIFRPCCNNPTHFPDCNHGMAMLGLLELMAAQDMSEEEMYGYALRVNAYWFPQTYVTIAKYFAEQGVAWTDVNPKEVLGYDYSSASGYRNILSSIEPANASGGGSCGV